MFAFRRTFENRDTNIVFAGGQSGTHCGVARADHHYVVFTHCIPYFHTTGTTLAQQVDGFLVLPPAAERMFSTGSI